MPDPVTAAFLRYLRQEIDQLSPAIESGYLSIDGRPDIAQTSMRSAFRSIVAHFVHLSGALTSETISFWKAVDQFFKSEIGVVGVSEEEDTAIFLETHHGSDASGSIRSSGVDLDVLRAIARHDCDSNSTDLPRAKMLLWRFAAAVVAADSHGTIDEEAALEDFRKLLDAEVPSAEHQ